MVSEQVLRAISSARKNRRHYFTEGLFSDPAWDMLLSLYTAQQSGKQESITNVCIAADVLPSTGLRWIGALAESGLIQQEPDPDDEARVLVSLSPEGLMRINAYFTAVHPTLAL